jgi:hypothetical protein
MDWTKSIATEYQTGEREDESLEEIEERENDLANCNYE